MAYVNKDNKSCISNKKFINECFDSLAKGKPILVDNSINKLGGKLTCIDFLLSVKQPIVSNNDCINVYQFGRPDIDFTEKYCNSENGEPMSCISKICEFHSNVASGVYNESVRKKTLSSMRERTKLPECVALVSKDVQDDMTIFYSRYIDNIKNTTCSDGLSCLNTMIERDPLLSNSKVYNLTIDDLEFEGCSAKTRYAGEGYKGLSCLSKIIVEGSQYQINSSVTGGIEHYNAYNLLKFLISFYKSDEKFYELLSKNPNVFSHTKSYMDMILSSKISLNDDIYDNLNRTDHIFGSASNIRKHIYNEIGMERLTNFDCLDKDNDNLIKCNEKLLLETISTYYNYRDKQFLVSVIRDKSISPCSLIRILGDCTPVREFNGINGLYDETRQDILQASNKSLSEYATNKTILCPSIYNDKLEVDAAESMIENGSPFFALTTKTAKNRLHNGKCKSIIFGTSISCSEKALEMLSKYPTHNPIGKNNISKFAIANYTIQNVYKPENINFVPTLLEMFDRSEINPNGTANESMYTENWKDMLSEVCEDSSGYIWNAVYKNEPAILHMFENLKRVYKPEKVSNAYETITALYLDSPSLRNITEQDKNVSLHKILPFIDVEKRIEIMSRWINDTDTPESEICNVLKSNSDWLTAVIARKESIGNENSDMYHAYKTCFGSSYPNAFGFTPESRKYYDYLCYKQDDLFSEVNRDGNTLIGSITGAKYNDPESLNSSYDMKPDEYDITGVYDININSSFDEDAIIKYIYNVEMVWSGWDSLLYSNAKLQKPDFPGLKYMYMKHKNPSPLIVNIGTRKEPINAQVIMKLHPEVGVDDWIKILDYVKNNGDFTVQISYINTIAGYTDISLDKLIPFSKLLSDMPKNIRNHLMKNNQKLYNLLQNITNLNKDRKPVQGRYKLVVSNRNADIARSTSCQPWSEDSCLNLYDGCYRHAVKTYAHFGSYIAYLVNKNPNEPQWLARLFIHKAFSRGNGMNLVPSLSIQDDRSHYSVKKKYWEIIYDAVKIIFAEHGINEDVYIPNAEKFSWYTANKDVVDQNREICDDAINEIVNDTGSYEMSSCMDECVENSPSYPDCDDKNFDAKIAKLEKKCEKKCADIVRENFNCLEYIYNYFEDDEDPPFYVDYNDTNSVQKILKDGSDYKRILTFRTGDLFDPEKFVKKISDSIV